ncbi:MAG: SUMF1/EgtB/PvdO family nonheme iron enzyme [Deltaproteobacteria bacterium]|nr:SUMF1/EgtB/PvdO family nonheme iron enzyme [Deltaproteobacteria bacterium]
MPAGSHAVVLASSCGRVELDVALVADETRTLTLADAGETFGAATYVPKPRAQDGKPLDVHVRWGEFDAGVVSFGQAVSVPACETRVTLAADGLGSFIETLAPKAGERIVRAVVMTVGTDMIRIPGGHFELGPPAGLRDEVERKLLRDEGWPLGRTDMVDRRVPVDIRTFDIDRHEVTGEQFVACRAAAKRKYCYDLKDCQGNNACYLMENEWDSTQGERTPACVLMPEEGRLLSVSKGLSSRPMNCVQRRQAEQYCKWLGKRLLTEAEWEYVARNRRSDIIQPWGMERMPPGCTENLCRLPNDVRQSVCSHPRLNTADGVCDMMSSVAELVTPIPGLGRDPDALELTMRGGDTGALYGSYPWDHGDIEREPFGRTTAYARADIGFRCARDVTDDAP